MTYRILENSVALVTGGSQGIGEGIALQLALSGAHVIVTHLPNEIDERNAEAVSDEISRKAKVRVIKIPMDVSDQVSVHKGLAQALLHFPKVDILVNNAGVMQELSGMETTDDDFDRCFKVNIKGVWNVVSGILPHFLRQRTGKVVNISSTAGRRGQAEIPAYCASKSAVISLTQSLATALGPNGINVNAVCPGLVRTPQSEKFLQLIRASTSGNQPDMKSLFEASWNLTPLRRRLTADDIGHAVCFLASSRANCITGQSINVDGGYTTN